MKIKVISKGGRKPLQFCPWMLDVPPESDQA